MNTKSLNRKVGGSQLDIDINKLFNDHLNRINVPATLEVVLSVPEQTEIVKIAKRLINERVKIESLQKKNPSGTTLLQFIIFASNVELLVELFNEHSALDLILNEDKRVGKIINTQDSYGNTISQYLAGKNIPAEQKSKIAKYLISRGMKAIPNGGGVTAEFSESGISEQSPVRKTYNNVFVKKLSNQKAGSSNTSATSSIMPPTNIELSATSISHQGGGGATELSATSSVMPQSVGVLSATSNDSPFVKVDKSDQLDKTLVQIINNIKQTGGAMTTETIDFNRADLTETVRNDTEKISSSEFINSLLERLRSQHGGKKLNKVSGIRTLVTNTEFKPDASTEELMEGGKQKKVSKHKTESDSDDEKISDSILLERDRARKNKSEEIHERTVKRIMEIMNVNEDDAKIYKSYLYFKVKDEHPELSSYDRAIEMEKLATVQELSSINFQKIKQHYIEKKEEKQQLKSSSESESPSNKKPKKEKTVKTRKPRKTKEVGELSSDSNTVSATSSFDSDTSDYLVHS
jgi:hypothetical protein